MLLMCIVVADGMGGARDSKKSVIKGIGICIFYWHIEVDILVSLSQAAEQNICLKSWGDKKKRIAVAQRVLPTVSLFLSFMHHKLEAFKQLGVVAFCVAPQTQLIARRFLESLQSRRKTDESSDRNSMTPCKISSWRGWNDHTASLIYLPFPFF